MKFSRQDRGLSDAERALRSARPEIDQAVQGEILARISARPAQRSRGFRVVLAGVMTAGVFGAMAAFGGVSYATNSVYHSTGVSNSNKGWSYTPSCDQYGKDGGKHKKTYGNYPGKGGKNTFGGFGFFGGW